MAPKSLKEHVGTVPRDIVENFNRLMEPRWSDSIVEEDEGVPKYDPKSAIGRAIKRGEESASWLQRSDELKRDKRYSDEQKKKDIRAADVVLNRQRGQDKKSASRAAKNIEAEIAAHEKSNPKHALDAELKAIDDRKQAKELERFMDHDHKWVKDPKGRANFHCSVCGEMAGMDRAGNVVHLKKNSPTLNSTTVKHIAGTGSGGRGLPASSGGGAK